MLKLLTAVFLSVTSLPVSQSLPSPARSSPVFVSFVVNPATTTLRMFWKDAEGRRFGSLGAVKKYLNARHEALLFAMNGGMYMTDGSPLGLYIENNRELAALNRKKGKGNFYLQPNGILYINSKKEAAICSTSQYPGNKGIAYATQSGPMLLVDGVINPAFAPASTNLNTWNGAGILPGNRLLFAMSREPVSLYAFADFFKKAGCRDALYLDGFVSKVYYPGGNESGEGGDFGVIIAVTKNLY